MPPAFPDPALFAEVDERLTLRGIVLSRLIAQNHASMAATRATATRRQLERARRAGADPDRVAVLEDALSRHGRAATIAAQHAALCRRREEVLLLPNPKVAAFGRVEDQHKRPLHGVTVQILRGETVIAEEKTSADGTFAVYYVPPRKLGGQQNNSDLAQLTAPTTHEVTTRTPTFILRIGAGHSVVDRELHGVGTTLYQAACKVQLPVRADAPAGLSVG